MNTILELLITLNAAGSVVVACILILRLLPAGAFPTKWRYGLSKMAVGFFLFPVVLGIQWIVSLTFNAAATVPAIGGQPSTVEQGLSGTYSGFSPEPLITGQTITAQAALFLIIVWATGVIVFATWQLYCYRKFVRTLEHSRTAVPRDSQAVEQLSLIKEPLGLKRNVRLAYSSALRSPVLVGLWKPTIYLPKENIVNVNMDMVMRHELIHLKRKDLWVKAFTLGASALHWFNPFIHILRKDIHTWSELSCDEEVVREMSHAERKRYGETILNVMAGTRHLPVRFCASLSGDGQQLKRRLMMMLNVKKLRKKTLYLTITAVFSVAAISTSAAVWAAHYSPEVIPYEEGQAEVRPSEQIPKAAPAGAVIEKEPNPAEAQPSQAPATLVAENESDEEVQVKEPQPVPTLEPEPATEPKPKKSSTKAPSVTAPVESSANNGLSAIQTPSTTMVPKEEDKPGLFGPELRLIPEPAPDKDSRNDNSHSGDIPPGTSITIRKLTPEESAEFKDRELAARALLSPEEQAEFEEDDYGLRPDSIPPGTSITIRKLTPEESAEFKERELAARALLSPEEQAEFED
ncbi:M56 family metallopeptidase [Paenibacillus naphthalenovorans]|uniref:M56 family metallopeptidase n=1 Tax=Paenibacillus naphthalenovorans TaxID=162209 RepID=UPI0010FA488F|nr:M56 family metallopeptidase [Paenibacillus naphthalenovorans]